MGRRPSSCDRKGSKTPGRTPTRYTDYMNTEDAPTAWLRAALALYEHAYGQGFAGFRPPSAALIPLAEWREFEAGSATHGKLPEEFMDLRYPVQRLKATARPSGEPHGPYRVSSSAFIFFCEQMADAQAAIRSLLNEPLLPIPGL